MGGTRRWAGGSERAAAHYHIITDEASPDGRGGGMVQRGEAGRGTCRVRLSPQVPSADMRSR